MPHLMCWDRRASAEDVHSWVARLTANPRDQASEYLPNIGDPRAAVALRDYLGSDDVSILSPIIQSLAWSGDESDGPALMVLRSHTNEIIRIRAIEAMTDLGIPGTADGLWATLVDSPTVSREAKRILDCLIWLRDERALPVVRELFVTYGFKIPPLGFKIADALARLGTDDDRNDMANAATVSLEGEAANDFTRTRYQRSQDWNMFVRAVAPVRPNKVEEALSALSPAALNALTWNSNEEAPVPISAGAGDDVETVARRSIVWHKNIPVDGCGEAPAKFFGQPDWRETPAWPVGGDGQLLMFYGQLPLGSDGEFTAYLFTGGPDESEVLGPGSAVVIQPGNKCHLATLDTSHGPQSYEWVHDMDRFISRSRRLPQKENYLSFEDGLDPVLWSSEPAVPVSRAQWNKIGGTPIWLQNDDTPETGEWTCEFQFEADLAGSERGDGAVFYGWTDSAGAGALGWQCH